MNEAAALPSPAVLLSARLKQYYGRLRRPPGSRPLPGVTGYRTPRSDGTATRAVAGRRAGEGLPSSRRHLLDIPRPIRREVLGGCASRLFTASLAFAVISAARLLLAPRSRARPLTTLQASRDAADRPVAPPSRAFDAALRPDPFPDRAASLLPGLPAATRTGLTPSGGDEHEQQVTYIGNLPFRWAHESRGLATRSSVARDQHVANIAVTTARAIAAAPR